MSWDRSHRITPIVIYAPQNTSSAGPKRKELFEKGGLEKREKVFPSLKIFLPVLPSNTQSDIAYLRVSVEYNVLDKKKPLTRGQARTRTTAVEHKFEGVSITKSVKSEALRQEEVVITASWINARVTISTIRDLRDTYH